MAVIYPVDKKLAEYINTLPEDEQEILKKHKTKLQKIINNARLKFKIMLYRQILACLYINNASDLRCDLLMAKMLGVTDDSFFKEHQFMILCFILHQYRFMYGSKAVHDLVDHWFSDKDES